MLCERNDDVANNALFIACTAACEKVNMPWAGQSIDAARAQRETCLYSGSEGRNLSAVGAYCQPTYDIHICQHTYMYDSDILKCKQSPCSIDAASIQILSNATLTLIVVCDVTLSSHLSTLNFIFAL